MSVLWRRSPSNRIFKSSWALSPFGTLAIWIPIILHCWHKIGIQPFEQPDTYTHRVEGEKLACCNTWHRANVFEKLPFGSLAETLISND